MKRSDSNLVEAGDNSTATGSLARWLRPQDTPLPTVPDLDYSAAVRTGLWLLGLGLGGFLVWAVAVPLDEGVPAQGVLSADTKRKRIDHLAGGLVEKILVREGQRVNEGDELIILNEVQSKAALNSTQGQWVVAAAAVARLEAERSGAGELVFPPELRAMQPDPDAVNAMRAQENLFRSRRKALDGELGIIRESVRGLEGQARSLEQLKAGREKQIALFNTQLASYQALNQKGFVSRNQLLDLERQLAEIQSKQSEDLANIGGINARLAELRMRDNQRLLDYRREVEAQMTDVRKEMATLAERLVALRDSHARLSIRAPVSGTVVEVAVHTVGGVVKPGDRIMDIVPDGDDLVVEAQIPPQYIDRVRAGLPADVHFDAYVSLSSQPVVSGSVSVVSADVLTDPRSGNPYYAVRVSIPATQAKRLGKVPLHSGMQCTVMVKTGERTLMAYLTRPVLRRFTTALSES